nr:hypothetical protein L203_03749 [Cryptococcus depauperatus CBS 7841]
MNPLSPEDINGGWPSPSTAAQYTYKAASTPDNYAREPKVFGAPGMGLVNPPQETQDKAASKAYLRVRIGTLERNRKDLLIRFDANTNLPKYKSNLYRNMQRSYVEFQKFAEQMQLVCPQTIIPAIPLPSTSALTDEEDDRLVRIGLQRWFSRICEDPVLIEEDELQCFIESDFGASRIPNQCIKLILDIVRRGPFDDDDDLQSAKIALEKLEERYAHSAALVNQVGKAQRQLAASQAEAGGKWVGLSTVESDDNLAGLERKLGRVLEGMSGMMASQTANEDVILSDSLGYQALNARAAKETLLRRTAVLEDSQAASKIAINKRRNVERLKSSSNISSAKVDDAIHEMQEANALEDTLTQRLFAISQNLHVALRTHSRYAHEDIAISLLEAARLRVGYHKQQLRELESLRNDLNKVAPGAKIFPSGGASTKPGSAEGARLPTSARSSAHRPVYQPPFTFRDQTQGSGTIPTTHSVTHNQSPSQPQSAAMLSADGGQNSSQNHQLPSPAKHPVSHSPNIPRAPTSPSNAAQGYFPSDGTHSMFVPSGRASSIPRPHSAAPHPGPDPLGGFTGPGLPGPTGNSSEDRLAKSVFLSGSKAASGQAFTDTHGFPSHFQPSSPNAGLDGPQRAATVINNRKKLDEKKAAKMLAGGF